MCSVGKIENELHFLTECELYNVERRLLYSKINRMMPMFDDLNDEEKLIVMMKDFPRQTSQYLYNAYLIRRNMLYR
jgi:competence protein ComGF